MTRAIPGRTACTSLEEPTCESDPCGVGDLPVSDSATAPPSPLASRDVPRVSVLLCVRDGFPFVADALASVLSDDFADLEAVVVDDASRDATPHVLAGIARRDPRVRVQRNDENLGLTRSLNVGLALCRAPLVARLDADDRSEPGRLAAQCGFLDENPAVALVAGAARVHSGESDLATARSSAPPPRILAPPATHEAIRARLLVNNPLIHSATMFRRQAALELGGYDERFVVAQDYDLWSRLARSHRLAGMERVVVEHERRAGGISRARAEEQERAAVAIARRNLAEFVAEVAAMAPAASAARVADASVPSALSDAAFHRLWRALEDRPPLAISGADAEAGARAGLWGTLARADRAYWGRRVEELARRCFRARRIGAGLALRRVLAREFGRTLSASGALGLVLAGRGRARGGRGVLA